MIWRGFKTFLFGKPLETQHLESERLSKVTGLAVLSSDALSSVAYAAEALLLVLMAAGIGLRFYAIRTLGKYFTVTVRTHQAQRVIETGPYRLVRHPSYSASLLTFAGMCLALANWLVLVTIVFPVMGFAYRIRVEEAVLLDALGDDYRRYMRHTKRLVPYLV